jgi:thiamine biosynthesis protein ThiS
VITVNGKPRPLEPGDTVEALLGRLGLRCKYTLVEHNGEALERARYGETQLADGDRIVVARAVAGG